MSFTDEDLKRLKADCDFHGPAEECVEIVPNHLLALLTRLEAAEAIVEMCGPWNRDFLEGSEWDTTIKAWRKAAGK